MNESMNAIHSELQRSGGRWATSLFRRCHAVIMYLMRCEKNKDHGYTLKKTCPKCKEPTVSAHPARFSPDDRFSKQRVATKRRFGLLLTQQAAETL